VAANGTLLSEFGFRGGRSTPGSINFAWSSAVQPGTGDVFVANRESNNVVVFSPSGTYINQWGAKGTGPGQFNLPQGITFAPDGTLLVSDSGNGRIERFSISTDGKETGTWLATYGQSGTASQGAGFLQQPTGISVGSDGTVWVADTLNAQIQRFALSTGTWAAPLQAPTNGLPFGLAWGVRVGPDGNIWIAESSLNRIAEMSPSGESIFTATGQQLGTTALNGPSDIAFGPAGQVWVSDTWNNRVITLST
jgi:DNA-binding beta-propeller fold protein YncE